MRRSRIRKLAASRGSRNGANSDSTIGMRRNSLPNEFLIMRGRVRRPCCGPGGRRASRITLIAPEACAGAATVCRLHADGDFALGW